jgi:hypothetical protein
VATTRVAGTTVSVRFAVAVCAGDPESVTLKVSGAETAVVGVPLMRPVEAFNANPGGIVPAMSCHV